MRKLELAWGVVVFSNFQFVLIFNCWRQQHKMSSISGLFRRNEVKPIIWSENTWTATMQPFNPKFCLCVNILI